MAYPRHLRTPPLRELMRRLRRNAPLVAPVRLIQKPGVRCGGQLVAGCACYRQKWPSGKVVRFRITVDSRLSRAEKWDVIVHEWAHCLDRGTRPKQPKDCHDARWGQCLSRAYRASLP